MWCRYSTITGQFYPQTSRILFKLDSLRERLLCKPYCCPILLTRKYRKWMVTRWGFRNYWFWFINKIYSFPPDENVALVISAVGYHRAERSCYGKLNPHPPYLFCIYVCVSVCLSVAYFWVFITSAYILINLSNLLCLEFCSEQIYKLGENCTNCHSGLMCNSLI